MNEAVSIEAPPEMGSEVMTALTDQRLRTSEEWGAMLAKAGLVTPVKLHQLHPKRNPESKQNHNTPICRPKKEITPIYGG